MEENLSGNPINNTRTSLYPASISASNQGFRGCVVQTEQRPVHKIISLNNDTPRAQKLYDPKTVKNDSGFKFATKQTSEYPHNHHIVGRGGPYKRRGRPKISPGNGSGSLVHKGYKGTLGVQHFKSLVKSPLAQDISKNNVYGNGKEPVTINTGIPVEVLDGEAVILTDLNSLQFPLNLENDAVR